MAKTNTERAAYAREWRKKNPEKARKYTRDYYAKHRDDMQFRDQMRRSYRVAQHRQRRYGITQEQFDALLERQGGACAICVKHLNASRAHTDHDHVTGKVRGILCAGCNHGLGYIEKLGFVEMARAYLARPAAKH